MRKIINSADTFVQDTMEGIIAAYGDKVKLLNDDFRVLLSNYPTQDGKVGIVTAGGSGHLPVFLGYVGKGLLDGCAVGEVFASPASEKMADMIRACDRGNGVLCLFGLFGGGVFHQEVVPFRQLAGDPLGRVGLEEDLDRLQDQLDVDPDRVLLDVDEVEDQLVAGGGVVLALDLGEAGEAGFDL